MDVTPVMTCVFVVMCCSMLVLLYYFYDHLGASLLASALQKCGAWQGEGRGFGRGLSPASAGRRSPCPGIRVHGALLGGVPGPRCPGLLLTATLFCSLRDHWDFLPGLLHGPLQLPVATGPEAAIWQMQVSSQVAFPQPHLASCPRHCSRGPAPRPLLGPTTLSPVSWPLRLQVLLL